MIGRTFFALFTLFLPLVAAAATPGEIIARQFVHVLRNDDFRELPRLIDDPQKDPRAWRELWEILDRFDCITVLRYEWSPISTTDDSLSLRLEINGTAELKAAWRPQRPLPRTWHIEARRVGDTWKVVKAITEERRVGLAMKNAGSTEDAECILSEARNVDTGYLLTRYALDAEHEGKLARTAHAVELARKNADIATEIFVTRRHLVLFSGSNQAQALEGAREMEALARASGSNDEIAGALLTSGLVHYRNGDLEGACDAYRAADAIAETLDDPLPAIQSLQMLNWIETRTNILAAFPINDRMDELSRRYRWEDGIRNVLFNRANVHKALGNNEVARATYQKLLELGKATGNQQTVNLSLLNLAIIELHDKHYAEAVRLIDESGEAESRGYIPTTPRAMLAEAHLALGELDQAQAALAISENSTIPFACAEVVTYHSRIHLARGDLECAIASARDALQRLDRREELQSNDQSSDAAISNLQAHALTTLARALRQGGEIEQAVVEMKKAITVVENWREHNRSDAITEALFLRDYLDIYAELAEMLVEEDRIGEAFAVAERMKARGLRDTIDAGHVDTRASMSEAERSREDALENRLEELNRSLMRARERNEPPRALDAQLAEARRELDGLRAELAMKYPVVSRLRAADQTTVRLPDHAGSLAVIEYVVAEKQVLAFVLTPTALRVEQLPVTRKELERDARDVTQLIAARSPAYKSVARRLYALLMAPLERHLHGAATLAVVPDGALWLVPFQALITPSGTHLVEGRAVFYAHSLALLQNASERRTIAASEVIAFGNPTVGTGARATMRSAARDVQLGPLVEAEEEVRRLSTMYSSQRSRFYYRDEAQETIFKAEAPRFGIIHVAAHAVVDDRAPMYSAIVLASSGRSSDDGLLEAREIVDLQLNAEMAVLSACETARGKVGTGEGVIGLPWAFFAAGCPTTVVSQWNAESAATAHLMVELHRRLLAGDTIAAALRAAQLSVRRMSRYRHPFYWAPFVAIGAGGRQLSVASTGQ